ncbi:MAG: hypothetical protein GEU80_16825 [Dehalococcoidia bacterium]|nr:hypothetical protein [Dehalococcoidia bacterium]
MGGNVMRPSSTLRFALLSVPILAAAVALLALVSTIEAATPQDVDITPSTGPAAGGTSVEITGTGFLAGPSLAVTFNGVPATDVQRQSDTRILAVTPPGAAGEATVKVTNGDGLATSVSNGFTYLGAAPTVTDVDPDSGPTTGGTSVEITGTGFKSGAAVRFGGTAATNVNIVSLTRITARTPAHAVGEVDVVVTNTDTQSGSRSDAFTYEPAAAPAVTSVSPDRGSTGGGTIVTIRGTGFASGATVRFGNNAATNVDVESATRIIAVTPSRGSTGAVDVRVTNSDGQNGQRNNAFTYITAPAPVINSLSPDEGPRLGGQVVTITGSNFLSGAVVAFGGANATTVNVRSASRIEVVVPSRSRTGDVSVRVTNPDGKSHQRSNFYTYLGAPGIDSVSPAIGTTGGDTLVTIRGTNFSEGMTVRFGGTRGTDVDVVNRTTLTVRTPEHNAGRVDVRIESSAGERATRSNGYTYRVPATITGLSPTSGPMSGGTMVTITGAGFDSGSTVTVGGVRATQVDVVSSSRITARTPGRPTGPALVEVRTSDGVLASGTRYFVYDPAPPPGQVTGGAIPRSGAGLFVFSGGSNNQLVAAAVSAGCPQSRVSFFATAGGRFVTYLPDAPAFVNAAWNSHFSGGIPPSTPLIAACR